MNRRELMVGTAAASVVAALPALPQFIPEDCFPIDNLLVKCSERYAVSYVSPYGKYITYDTSVYETREYNSNGVEKKFIEVGFADGSTLSLPDPAAEILESASIRRGLPL